MRKIAIATLAAAALVLGACDKGGNESKPGTATGATSAAAATGSKGMNNPGNDAAIVALAKPVLACKWSSYGFDSKCEALQTWKKSDTMKAGAGDATLVNFLEDADSKVQWLGADALSRKGQKYRADTAMATKVVDAADKATDKQLVSALGRAVGNIDLKKTGLVARVMKMIEGHANAALRQTLAGNTLFRNRDVPGMFELFVKLAKTDKDNKVRKAAAAAFWTGTPTGKNEDVCKLWLELANDADQDLAGHSAYHCAFTSSGGGCTGQWDDLLSLIEKKAKAGEVKSSFMASALKYFYGQKKATDAQKKRALAIAKELVKNEKNDGSSRSSALDFIGKEDAGGKAFAAKYENDKEFFVKNAAKRIKEGK
jgi:hypothetical protein